MTTKEQIKAVIKQYADKGERLLEEAYENGERASTTGYWDGYKDCANGLLRELEDIDKPKFKVGDRIFFKQCKENRLKIITVGDKGYYCEDGTFLHFDNQYLWELAEEQEPRYPSFEESQGECHPFQDIALNG